MQIVIDIPDVEWRNWQENGEMDAIVVGNALKGGVALPKGHGRLIDADALTTSPVLSLFDTGNDAIVAVNIIDDAPTVIERSEE